MGWKSWKENQGRLILIGRTPFSPWVWSSPPHILKILTKHSSTPNYSNPTASALVLRSKGRIWQKTKCFLYNCTSLEKWMYLVFDKSVLRQNKKLSLCTCSSRLGTELAIIEDYSNKQPKRIEKKTRVLETVMWWCSEFDISIQHINGTNIRNEVRARSGILSRKQPRESHRSKSR